MKSLRSNYRVKLLYPSLLLLLITGAYARDQLVTIQVISHSLPARDHLYISGNIAELGNWQPDKIMLLKTSDSTWSKTFSVAQGTTIEFKLTLGSWLTEAIDEQGVEYANTKLTVWADTTLTLFVPNWRGLGRLKTMLSRQRLDNKNGAIELAENWRYQAGDDLSYAQVSYDDSNWPVVGTALRPEQLPQVEWHGIGWFRLHLTVDSSLWNKPLALLFNQVGAAEIFLNGQPLFKFGTVGISAETEHVYAEKLPQPVVFPAQSEQLLAVRYSNFNLSYLSRLGSMIGFTAEITELSAAMKKAVADLKLIRNYQLIFAVVPSTLAFIHLLFFLFYRKNKENLFFAICMLGFAVQVFCNFQAAQVSAIDTAWLLQKISLIAIIAAIIAGLFTSYWYINKRLPYQAFILLFLSLMLIVWILLCSTRQIYIVIYGLFGIGLFEFIRIFFIQAPRQGKREWLVAIGFMALLLFIIYQILIDLRILEPIGGNNIVYVYGVLFLGITVSVDLARDFARISEILLVQEREAREMEIQQRILRAENERKTQEIEEARKLQLSMLPGDIPHHSRVDISVFMRTATEVGGDYYDFKQFPEGDLVIALGDATGHGIKAGIMVTLIKSLFTTMGNVFYLPDFFNQCNRMIRGMSLGNLYMGLLLVRMTRNGLTLASAGMPPVLWFRADTGTVEEVWLKAIPLGAVEKFDYPQTDIRPRPGDTLLMMSDGYAEQFNERFEILDYERIKQQFLQLAQNPGEEIINRLIAFLDRWREVQVQNDDITFIVLKIK